ncbi:MAG: hypothetical protein M1482_02005 [Chloroflexi bacterium]|nr:hypothetical protein [Chloroflexota bacterium]
MSPSFVPHRRVGWSDLGYPACQAVEYALWWDWDIGHLYELEHAWTFVDSRGAIAAVEASWHGMYGQAENVALEGTHPVLYAQPGKHAMAGSVGPFEEIREWGEQEAGPNAGKGGVHETELFRGRLHKSPENDDRVASYLRQRAFAPSWKFTKRLPITREMLVPWEILHEWIPARVAWWLGRV